MTPCLGFSSHIDNASHICLFVMELHKHSVRWLSNAKQKHYLQFGAYLKQIFLICARIKV